MRKGLDMFSYYGSKSKIVKKYPPPLYDIIVEPFAGSARYSLLYNDKQVILNDSYRVIYNIWKYLITATEQQINDLPVMVKGDDVRDLNITDVEKELMGFMVNRGVAYPHNIYTTWPSDTNEIQKCKNRILNYLDKIRHWQIRNEDYRKLENIEATWYIDPPYQKGGERYIKNHIDYVQLAEWCKSRKGQVIVCENGDADWLDFEFLSSLQGQKKKTNELIWYKNA